MRLQITRREASRLYEQNKKLRTMNYKLLITLAALALIIASCTKDEMDNETRHATSLLTPVQLTLTMPDADNPATRAAFEVTDPTKPFKLKATWRTDETMVLILFQGDNANWKTNCIVRQFKIPASANGQTKADLSEAVGTVDLSTFNPAQNIKYVVVSGGNFNIINNMINLGNGVSTALTDDLTIDQEWYYGQLFLMTFLTRVQETPFPTGALQLSGKLEWLTAVLAVQFEIDPAADLLMEGDKYMNVYLQGKGEKYPQLYDPVLRTVGSLRINYSSGIQFTGSGSKKLSGALDSRGFRYFHIPADDAANGVEIRSTSLFLNVPYAAPVGRMSGVFCGSFNSTTPILPGYCYGVKIKVTLGEDGKPVFTRVAGGA
ncbi:MAG: hypothetical protein Q4G63_08695 [Bacteroidia bacterium]|nr:hypothetical protein [Bacteroidia bacterium]